MKKFKKFEKWYMRYVIKNPLLFYIFLVIGIALFLIMTLLIKMDNGTSLLEEIFINVGRGV